MASDENSEKETTVAFLKRHDANTSRIFVPSTREDYLMGMGMGMGSL